MAQDVGNQAGKQEVGAYAGTIFGDDLTDRAISGQTPKLDDDVTFGLRYAYSITDPFALEVQVGRTGASTLGRPASRAVSRKAWIIREESCCPWRPGRTLIVWTLRIRPSMKRKVCESGPPVELPKRQNTLMTPFSSSTR